MRELGGGQSLGFCDSNELPGGCLLAWGLQRAASSAPGGGWAGEGLESCLVQRGLSRTCASLWLHVFLSRLSQSRGPAALPPAPRLCTQPCFLAALKGSSCC